MELTAQGGTLHYSIKNERWGLQLREEPSITLLKMIKSLWDRNMGGWAYSSGQNPLSKMSKACVTIAGGWGGGRGGLHLELDIELIIGTDDKLVKTVTMGHGAQTQSCTGTDKKTVKTVTTTGGV